MPATAEYVLEASTIYPGGGEAPLSNCTVHVRDGLIAGIGASAGSQNLPRIRCSVLAPGFIDIQINGAGDGQFNDAPDTATLKRMVQGAAKGGTAHLLATYITAPGFGYRQAMEAVERAREGRLPGLLGLHLEGPFISPRRPGIHPAKAIRPLGDRDFDILLGSGDHPRLITLAPEECAPGAIERLASAGWRVFLGHSLASYELIQSRIAEGLSGATHLFNAMPPLAGREPGPVGAVLDGSLPFAGLIADGIHVHPANLALAYSCAGPDRLCLVSDAMLTLGGTATEFSIGDKRVHLRDGRLVDDQGTLGGANLAMDEAVRNMIRLTSARPQDALAMASTTPAKALGLENELGYIRPGHRASFTICDTDLKASATISDGVLLHREFDSRRDEQWAILD
ncbi:N-acetylglucosamine-6-phosphate deacetylase [Nitratireductor basaltis]|uniref:N-acetylglucosamine-6-phosphate deacetylase n=1 Tax=Nitratireductor basaltis TaxID=472175 RepID=A0A084U8M3_9HYPH|nr:N-acetylglucosamine-6-phosphate deacetylase [Nitratireductor basaltis]KFB09309.1 N-acetylglucosamine-6-phosphate deacetylase [Nitratireductor basaltis]